MAMTAKRFTGEIYAGHTTDCGVIVPFDPSSAWKTAEPLPIGYRKFVGYAVRGTVNKKPFESWIFHYFHQWRMVVPESVLAVAALDAGDSAEFEVRPHPKPLGVAKFAPGPKRT